MKTLGRCSGATYRQLYYWRQAGMFGPKAVAIGSGNGRGERGEIFTSRDVQVARAARVLTEIFGPDSRVPIGVLTQLAEEAVDTAPDCHGRRVLVVSPEVTIVLGPSVLDENRCSEMA